MHARRLLGIIAVFGLCIVLAYFTLGTSRGGESSVRSPDGQPAPPPAPDEGSTPLAQESALAAPAFAPAAKANGPAENLGAVFNSTEEIEPPPLPFV